MTTPEQHAERVTPCGFCTEGEFWQRPSGDRPGRNIVCPYCGGSGKVATIDLGPPPSGGSVSPSDQEDE